MERVTGENQLVLLLPGYGSDGFPHMYNRPKCEYVHIQIYYTTVHCVKMCDVLYVLHCVTMCDVLYVLHCVTMCDVL